MVLRRAWDIGECWAAAESNCGQQLADIKCCRNAALAPIMSGWRQSSLPESVVAANHESWSKARYVAADPQDSDSVVASDAFRLGEMRPMQLLDPGSTLRRGLVYADMRLKRDVQQMATLDNGINLYRYRDRWSPTEFVGVLAQEVV
jgi:hypothetical protein